MTLSVIIPVYSVESTLDCCVESVLRQHIDDMEVILVDDGSPDRCPEKCDEWAEKDSRIHVIHKKNGGLSDARNAGIDYATGEYITFVDSDDWLSEDTFPPLLKKMSDIDILEYSIADRLSLQERTYDNVEEYWLSEQAYTHTYACNKIYRRSIFDEVRFPKGRIFEDAYTYPQLLRKVKKIATTNQGSYHYTVNPTGITATADGHQMTQLLEAHINNGMPIDDLYYMYLVNIKITIWEQTGNSILISMRKVNTAFLPGKFRFKAIILNTFGIKTLCRLCKIIHFFKKPNHTIN